MVSKNCGPLRKPLDPLDCIGRKSAKGVAIRCDSIIGLRVNSNSVIGRKRCARIVRVHSRVFDAMRGYNRVSSARARLPFQRNMIVIAAAPNTHNSSAPRRRANFKPEPSYSTIDRRIPAYCRACGTNERRRRPQLLRCTFSERCARRLHRPACAAQKQRI